MVPEQNFNSGVSPTRPDLSVVIVSWNVAELLAKCIDSIVAETQDLSVEVLVVDNASTDSTLEMLSVRFPWVQVLANSKNQGFARANNQALRLARGPFVFLLNPDTVLMRGALRSMLEFMRDHPDAGIVGPRLCYPNGKIQETCARLLPTLKWSFFCEGLKLVRLPVVGAWFWRRYMHPYDFNTTQEVEAISGAAMLLRHEVLNSVTGFGETYSHCGEDVDLCFRVRSEGWRIYYLCNADVVHFSGQSSQQAVVRTSVNSVLSVQEYFSRCLGVRQGYLNRIIAQAVHAPVLVVIGIGKLLAGIETPFNLKQRLQIAKQIWLWRDLE